MELDLLPLPIFHLRSKSKDLETKILGGQIKKEAKHTNSIFSFCQNFLDLEPRSIDYEESAANFMIRTYLENSLGLTKSDINKAIEQLRQTPVTMLNKLIFLPDQIHNIISDNKLLHKEKKLPEQQTENEESTGEMNNKSSKSSQREIQKRSTTGERSNIITPKSNTKKDQETKKSRISANTPKVNTPSKGSSHPSKQKSDEAMEKPKERKIKKNKKEKIKKKKKKDVITNSPKKTIENEPMRPICLDQTQTHGDSENSGVMIKQLSQNLEYNGDDFGEMISKLSKKSADSNFHEPLTKEKDILPTQAIAAAVSSRSTTTSSNMVSAPLNSSHYLPELNQLTPSSTKTSSSSPTENHGSDFFIDRTGEQELSNGAEELEDLTKQSNRNQSKSVTFVAEADTKVQSVTEVVDLTSQSDDAINLKSCTNQAGNTFTFNKSANSITIHNPQGESKDITQGDKCKLADGKSVWVAGVNKDGRVNFIQENGSLHQGYFHEIITNQTITNQESNTFTFETGTYKLHCSQPQSKYDEDMALATAQSITSYSNLTSRNNQLKDDDIKSETEESETTTLVPDETPSLSSIDSDEIIKTTYGRTPLVTTPLKAGTYIPAFEHSLHQNLLPMQLPFPTTFPQSSL